MTREEREQAARTLQEFYDFNKTLTPHGDSWLQADITINRYTQEELGKALPTAIAALRGPQPDSDTGLLPCGCGGKAILFHQPDIEGPGSDGDRWAVFCEKTCGMGTSDMTSPEYAVETWNTGMGWKGGTE